MSIVCDWPKPTREQDLHLRIVHRKNMVFIALLSVGAYYGSKALYPNASAHDVPTSASNSSAAIDLTLAIFQTIVFLFDTIWIPPLEPNEVLWNSLSLIGHAAYFTGQTLMVQMLYFWMTFLFRYVIVDFAILHFLDLISVWVSAQAIALTFLFLRLNWYEPLWRRDILGVMEKRFPGFGKLMLFTHLPAVVLGSVDYFLLRDAQALHVFGLSVTQIVIISFTYTLAYAIWLKMVEHVLKPGTCIYPFVKLLDTPAKIVGFAMIMWAATSGLALLLRYVRLTLM